MSIYISIAAYEDPDLVDTIKSALDNARFPDKLVFGICLQYEEEPDLSFLPKRQKRILSFDAYERPGLVRARFLLKKMFLKEDYFLQIDSHTVFDKDWDVRLVKDLNDLKEQKGQNAVLAFQITNTLSMNIKSKTDWIVYQECPLILSHNVWAAVTDDEVERFEKTQRITAGALFVDAKTISAIDTDQYTQAKSEVVYLSFCFLMNGYDIYTTNNVPISHDNTKYNEHLNSLILKNQPFDENNNKNFVSNFYGDAPENEVEMMKALVYNTGKFAVKGAKITIKDFWEKIGLKDHYESIKKQHDKLLYS